MFGLRVVDAVPEGAMVVNATPTFLKAMWKQGPMTMMVAAIMPTNSSVMATVLLVVLYP